VVELEIGCCRGCFGCFRSFIDICGSDLIYLYPIHELMLYHDCIRRDIFQTQDLSGCGLEPSTNINTVPPPLPFDIIFGPQSLSLVLPSTSTSSSTTESRWIRLVISYGQLTVYRNLHQNVRAE
jgi:hypothetical protein